MAKKPTKKAVVVEEPKVDWQTYEWTEQEAAFVQAYLRHGDVARAWVEGYRPVKGEDAEGFFDTKLNLARARLEGNKVLAHPPIRDYVQTMRAEIKSRLTLTKDVVLEELTKIAVSNMADFLTFGPDGQPNGYDFGGRTREELAAIQEMTIDTYMEGRGEDATPVKSVKFKLASKQNALDSLGRHLKLFTDVVEVNDITDAADVMTRRKKEQRARRLAEQAETEEEELSAEDQARRDERAREQAETEHLGEYEGDEAY